MALKARALSSRLGPRALAALLFLGATCWTEGSSEGPVKPAALWLRAAGARGVGTGRLGSGAVGAGGVAAGGVGMAAAGAGTSKTGGTGGERGASAGRQLASNEHAACRVDLANKLESAGKALELVTVETATASTSLASVALWQRPNSRSCWKPAGGPWSGFIGVNGFSDHHREGDGTTPTGFYSIGPIIYGNAPDPGTKEPYHRLVCGDWWDEDPRSPEYNTFQHVPCGQTPPFSGGSEALWTETYVYASFAVVNYNTAPVVPYAGSGIFIHADTGDPTIGCVAIPLPDLDDLLRWLDASQAPAVAMGPAHEITRF